MRRRRPSRRETWALCACAVNLNVVFVFGVAVLAGAGAGASLVCVVNTVSFVVSWPTALGWLLNREGRPQA